MKRQDLDIRFTEKVQEYINSGYHIHTNSFGGSDGTLRVDLIKGNDFIRVYIEKKYEKYDPYYLLIVAQKYLTKREMNSDTIWKHELTIMEQEKFWELNNRWLVTDYEYEAIEEKKKQRWTNKGDYKNYINQEKAKKIVLSFIKKQPKCKSVKLSDIEAVQKIIRADKSTQYRVYVKDKIIYMN